MKLSDSVTNLKFISESYAKKLSKLNIFSLKDLITHFPRTYSDTSKILSTQDFFSDIDSINLDEDLTFQGKIHSFKNIFAKAKLSIQNAILEDDFGQIEITFFNQPFLKNAFKEGYDYLVSGKVKKSKGRYKLFPKNTDILLSSRENVHLGRITPEYRLTSGISKKWFRNRIYELLTSINQKSVNIENEASEYLQFNVLESIQNVHFPDNFEELKKSIGDLSTLELINTHLKALKKIKKNKHTPSFSLESKIVEKYLAGFLNKLAFKLTSDQNSVLRNTLKELSEKKPANILIQGDVGSGKTIVAITLAYLFAKQGIQTVVLAPTTVLASQHYQTFLKIIDDENIKIELVSSENKDARSGDILIGTSAILARKSKLISKLGLVVVDEQHRFGVAQREELLNPIMSEKKSIPHFVNMTATPIPRTIAETFFGDISVHNINSKPKDRKAIKSYLVPEKKRKDCYKWVKKEIDAKAIQVYWICPLINDSEKLQAKAAKSTYEEVQALFPDLKIELLHGKLKSADKDIIMKNFYAGEIDILISTSVIEVGIDVPNATVIIVENAERFGLAQLHQIRGRVGRGEKQSHCFLFAGEELNESSENRLKFLAKNNNGIAIANFDLENRGPGEVYGEKQSGIPDLKIAKLNNIKQIIASKKIAHELYANGINEIKLFS